jgi:hypothetical protein
VFIFPRAFVVQETSGDGSRRCFVATTRGGDQREAKRREQNAAIIIIIAATSFCLDHGAGLTTL